MLEDIIIRLNGTYGAIRGRDDKAKEPIWYKKGPLIQMTGFEVKKYRPLN